MWIKRQQIPLTRIDSHFVICDLRKFTEQHSDIIQWNQSNRAYIIMHGVSGIDWKHYKHPLPENVCDMYMRYWADVRFSFNAKKEKKEARMLPFFSPREDCILYWHRWCDVGHAEVAEWCRDLKQ